MYGYIVNEYFTDNNKKYIIDIINISRKLNPDCKEQMARELRTRIFKQHGFNIINLNFRTEKTIQAWKTFTSEEKKLTLTHILQKSLYQPIEKQRRE